MSDTGTNEGGTCALPSFSAALRPDCKTEKTSMNMAERIAGASARENRRHNDMIDVKAEEYSQRLRESAGRLETEIAELSERIGRPEAQFSLDTLFTWAAIDREGYIPLAGARAAIAYFESEGFRVSVSWANAVNPLFDLAWDKTPRTPRSGLEWP
jgi:hypothetical protein